MATAHIGDQTAAGNTKPKRVFTAAQLARRKVTGAAFYAKRRAAGWKPNPRTKDQRERQKQTSDSWYVRNKDRVRASERARLESKPRGPRKLSTEQKERRRRKSAARLKIMSAETKARRYLATKLWRSKNKERHRAAFAKWAEKNRDRRNEEHRKWMAAHPEVRRFFHSKRRALKNDAEVGESKLIEAWEQKWRKAKRVRCFWCRQLFAGGEMHLDHVVALARGGKHAMSNVCTSCQPCNNRKKDKPIERWNEQIAEPVLL